MHAHDIVGVKTWDRYSERFSLELLKLPSRVVCTAANSWLFFACTRPKTVEFLAKATHPEKHERIKQKYMVTLCLSPPVTTSRTWAFSYHRQKRALIQLLWSSNKSLLGVPDCLVDHYAKLILGSNRSTCPRQSAAVASVPGESEKTVSCPAGGTWWARTGRGQQDPRGGVDVRGEWLGDNRNVSHKSVMAEGRVSREEALGQSSRVEPSLTQELCHFTYNIMHAARAYNFCLVSDAIVRG